MSDVDAQTGNSLIPANPEIAATAVAQGAQQVPGAQNQPVPVQQPPAVPAQSTDPGSPDFWGSVDQSVQQPPAVPTSPEQQPDAAQIPQVPPTVQGLTPEQLDAVLTAQAQAGQPQVPQQQPAVPSVPQVSQMEEQAIRNLEATEYALPDDVRTQLISDPGGVLPGLAARMHVRIASQLGQAVQNMLPSIVTQIVKTEMQAMNAENEFYRAYPQLADPRFRGVVAQSLAAIKAVNPNASREEVMRDGALLAANKLRINLSAQQTVQQPVAQPPVQQPVPQPTGVQQPAVAPFQPTVPGAPGVPPTPPTEENIFTQLAIDTDW